MEEFILNQLVEESVNEKGFKVIAQRPLSLYNDALKHLRVVLASCPVSAEFAVWLYDSSIHTLSEGVFTRVRETAYNNFYTRV